MEIVVVNLLEENHHLLLSFVFDVSCLVNQTGFHPLKKVHTKIYVQHIIEIIGPGAPQSSAKIAIFNAWLTLGTIYTYHMLSLQQSKQWEC
jgi:hypothetical protein